MIGFIAAMTLGQIAGPTTLTFPASPGTYYTPRPALTAAGCRVVRTEDWAAVAPDLDPAGLSLHVRQRGNDELADGLVQQVLAPFGWERDPVALELMFVALMFGRGVAFDEEVAGDADRMGELCTEGAPSYSLRMAAVPDPRRHPEAFVAFVRRHLLEG